MRTPFIAGNWKMNMSGSETIGFLDDLRRLVQDKKNIDIAICPPFPYLIPASQAAEGSNIAIGSQNMYWEDSGAFTGETSASMLIDAGCTYAIIGHSERRQYFGETDKTVRLKLLKAVEKGLKPIVCVGETLEQREAGRMEEVIRSQLEGALTDIGNAVNGLIIAYEPVWAIGTGKTATTEQAQAVHRLIREWTEAKFNKQIADSIRILYGGSVKPGNAGELVAQPDIDGALVGGASLKASTFNEIIEAVISISE